MAAGRVGFILRSTSGLCRMSKIIDGLFFFQAEDGIRDGHVTGVQTCALPISGKRALITGGDSGIGAAVAIAFAREGATVSLAHLPSEKPDADHVANLLDDAGVQVHHFPGDLQDHDYRDSLVNDAADAMGGLDILVNNAGRQIAVGDIAELTDEQVRHTYETNILAMFTLCRNAVKIMERGSAIINTTSIQAYQPSPQLIDYAATKAAINNFTKGLAAQVAGKEIRVHAGAPGPVWSPLRHGRVAPAPPRRSLPVS